MMAKHWRPGWVKTRLAATIGDAAAAELHRVFVRHLTCSLAACGDRRRILAAPDDCCDAFAAEIDPTWTVAPQGEGDLGQRMRRGFRAAMAAAGPSSRLLMIGADLPTLTAADLDAAFAALSSHDVVLGPACDGGYYLIGLCGHLADTAAENAHRWENLFQDVAWGTSAVLTQTLQLARQGGLSVKLLEPREDIDTQAELRRLIQRLRQSSAALEVALDQQIDDVLRRHRVNSVEMDTELPDAGAKRHLWLPLPPGGRT